MKRTVAASRPSVHPDLAPTKPERGLGQVMLLHRYRQKARLSRWLDSVRRRVALLRTRLSLVPRAFWIGMLAGLLLGAVMLVVTGHGGLFVHPVGHGRSGRAPSAFKSPA